MLDAFISHLHFSFHFLDVVQFPALVEERLEWSVEAKDREPSLFGNGPDPILLLAFGHFRAEINVH
jgi:hypothetical protein